MATGTSLIVRGLQMLGGKVLGGSLTSAEQTAYLAVLNAMLDSWSIERLMVPNLLQESKALTASVGSLTIGSGGTFNTTRPIRIVQPTFVRDASGNDIPLEIINADAYGKIVVKTIDGTYPKYLFYDGADVAGLATIYLYPEPAASLTLYINSWKQFTQFSAIGDTLVAPPGYERAIAANFAIEAAAGYRPVPPETAKIARESKAAIMGVNLPSAYMQMPVGIVSPGMSRGRSILTGP